MMIPDTFDSKIDNSCGIDSIQMSTFILLCFKVMVYSVYSQFLMRTKITVVLRHICKYSYICRYIISILNSRDLSPYIASILLDLISNTQFRS